MDKSSANCFHESVVYVQLVQHTAVLTLVLVVGKSSWTMFSVLQVLVNYQSAPVGQSCPTTVSIPMMQVWGVKVSLSQGKKNVELPYSCHQVNMIFSLSIVIFDSMSLSLITVITRTLQLHVILVSYDQWEVLLQVKAEWRSALTTCGALCVMTPGEVLMLSQYVVNQATLLKVSNQLCFKSLIPSSALSAILALVQ